MHDDQLDITTDIAARLVAAARPAWAGLAVTPVASAGTVNAIFRIGDDLAARFPLQPADDLLATLHREAERSARFAQVVDVDAPRPVGVFTPGEGYPQPWAVQTWVPGDVATPTRLATSDSAADDVAGLLATLRGVDVSGEGFRGYGRGDVLAPFDAYVRDCFDRSAGLFDVAAVARLWDGVRDLPRPSAFVLSHTDLTPANIVTDGGRLAGVLDTGDTSPADPALDLIGAWHLFDDARRDRIRSRLASDDDEWARGAAWALVQCVGLVWYYVGTNPVMAELGRSTLARLIGAAETIQSCRVG